MIKYKCDRCGYCFTEEEADFKNVLVDYTAPYGAYYQQFMVCPECDSDDYSELDLGKECAEYDEEFGCDGDCENCPINKEDDEGGDDE